MATKMFVIEQPLPNYWRRFIIDCPAILNWNQVHEQ